MIGADRYYKTMRPVIEECQRVHGFKSEILRQYNIVISPVKTSKQEFYMWFHEDDDKRIEPGAGTFLNLVQAIKEARKIMRRRGRW